jgi:hypothetical protein
VDEAYDILKSLQLGARTTPHSTATSGCGSKAEVRAELFPGAASQVFNLLYEVFAVELVPFPFPQERHLFLRPEVKILGIELGVAHVISPISSHRSPPFWDT